MATFAYTGRTRAGQNVTGERIADTMDAAVTALRGGARAGSIESDPAPAPPPDGLVPLAKLGRYLGANLACTQCFTQ